MARLLLILFFRSGNLSSRRARERGLASRSGAEGAVRPRAFPVLGGVAADEGQEELARAIVGWEMIRCHTGLLSGVGLYSKNTFFSSIQEKYRNMHACTFCCGV